MKKPTSLDPTLPPITLLLQEYHVTLLLRALRQYRPAEEEEYNYASLLDILEMIAMEN